MAAISGCDIGTLSRESAFPTPPQEWVRVVATAPTIDAFVRRSSDAMNVDPYLARIGYDGPLAVDAKTLGALQRAHLLAVPFENLSIMWGEPIALEIRDHYAKIVDRKRGGFCYEQNGLFAWALGEIGFRVSRLGAAVWSVRDGIGSYGDPTSHLLLKVDLDQPWIADVGFGENFRGPLRLIDGVVQDEAPRAFRLDRYDDAWTLSMRDAQGQWTPSYRFTDIARPIEYFTAMCRFHQTSPLSPFTQKRLCSIATRTGRLTLSGNEWIVSGLDGSRSVTPIADEPEACRLLKENFDITSIARTP